MILTPEYWEKLAYDRPSTEKNKVEIRDNYLLQYSAESLNSISNHADYIRAEDTDSFSTIVDEITAFYRNQNKSFMITLYDYINNDDEAQVLLNKGFEQTGIYQTMVAPVDNLIKNPQDNGIEIKIVEYTDLLDEPHLNILMTSFPEFFKDLDEARDMITRSNETAKNDDNKDIINFVAYDGSLPVGSAALYLDKKWDQVASLSGASVLPDYRGRGIYSGFLNKRAHHAKDLGYTHFMVTANTKTSAPIVAKKGFVKVNEFTDFQFRL